MKMNEENSVSENNAEENCLPLHSFQVTDDDNIEYKIANIFNDKIF